MSKSLLKSTSEKRPSFLYSMGMAGLSFGVSDKLQVSTMKAVCSEPGLPKKKHVVSLIEALSLDLNKWEEILLTVDAMSGWSTDRLVCCKVLITILQILQSGPTLIGTDVSPLKVLISNIQEHWSSTDMFLFELSLYLNQRIAFLEEHPSFNPHFNQKSMSSNGLSLPMCDVSTILSLVSRLLSMQGKLVPLLKIPFSHDGTADLKRQELFTYKCSLGVIFEDAYCIYVALTSMMQFVLANSEEFSSDLVSSFSQQYSDLFSLLSSAQTQLASSDSSDAELSKLPSTNPLLAGGKKTGKNPLL